MENAPGTLKNKRTPNFSNNEKQMLLSIIHKHKNVIENKKTDGVSIDEKNKAWEKVASEFNAACPDSRHRTVTSLKKFYTNKKMEVRKTVAEEKKERYLTGGGVPKYSDKDSDKELILSIINDKTVYGLKNPFDSDAQTIDIANIEIQFQDEEDMNASSTRQGTFPKQQDADEENAETYLTEDVDLNQQSGWGLNQFKSTMLSRPNSLKRNRITTQDSFTPARRRPTLTRALTSSSIGEKYELLVQKRLEIANIELQKAENDLKWQIEQQLLQKEAMLLDIEIKKQTLANLSE